MLYLDYAANTPVDPRVLDYYTWHCSRYIANPNSSHPLGREARARMDEVTEHIAELLKVKPGEIIYTSGASEANNLAIKGVVQAYKHNGKHIISTCLEHPSVSGALTHLQTLGYEIDLVDITGDGLIDLEHLKELLREDTVLVSVCYVDSELGVQQPIPELGELLKQYPNCRLHVDATQAVGKLPLPIENIDLLTFTPHKFFGMNGCGILIRKEPVVLEPLHHGGTSTTIYRSGTPALALAASVEKALELAMKEQEERNLLVRQLHDMLLLKLSGYKKVRINSTGGSVPHIINLSVQGVKGVLFQEALSQEGICVSVKSACSAVSALSRPVYAVTKDKKNAMCSWRISLSHWTTEEELEYFYQAFDRCYTKLSQ
ncbi:cysteine desulfurase [Anaerotaenia torta]|uniref:cysteine desulfurase family protein n=1 Tax=Anaerotaenia torta TaxID=433293 RepID=UPI003D25FB7F